MNPLLQNLPNPQLQQIKSMYRLMQGAKNPQAMLQQMASQNPNMKQVLDLVNQNGGDAQKAFYALAQQKGVNPNDILNQLR